MNGSASHKKNDTRPIKKDTANETNPEIIIIVLRTIPIILINVLIRSVSKKPPISSKSFFLSVSLLNGEKKVLKRTSIEKKLYKNHIILPQIEKKSFKAMV